jgi:membrane protease YdiL (CAAX protease family)
MDKIGTPGWRVVVVFVVLFVLYQSAEGIGGKLLHSFLVQASLMVACVAAAWPLSRWLGYRGYGAYALDRRLVSFAWLAMGLALALLAKGAAIVAGERLGIYAATGPSFARSGWAALAGAWPMLMLSTFVPSIAEDILARGFWYRAAEIRWRRGLAFVAFSAGYFVLNHLYRLDRGPTEWLMIFCMGLAYATALWRTGTLWAAVGLHWGWNLANGVLDPLLPADIVDVHGSALLTAVVHVVLALIMLAIGKPASASNYASRA